MPKIRWLIPMGLGLVSAGVAAQTPPAEDDGGFSSSIELIGTWDSNFSRNAAEEEEFITRGNLGVGYGNTFGKQRINTAVRFSQLDYHNNPRLNATIGTGTLTWQGQVGNKILFDLGATREAAPVPRIDFADKDIVTRNAATARIGYGTRNKLSVFVGGRATRQTRSADLLQFLNFDEDEVFLQAEYRTNSSWLHKLTLQDGERNFEITPESVRTDLDFGFSQVAYDVEWQASDKSRLAVGVARFERSGEVNSDTGTSMNAGWDWQMTPKVSLNLSYSLINPAIGEEINGRIKASGGSIGAAWDATDQWRLETSATHGDETFRREGIETDETFVSWQPLAIVFSRADFLRVQLDAEITERDSPVLRRDYDGVLTSLRFRLAF